MRPIGRRGFLKSVAAAAAAGPIILQRNAWAQGKTLHVGIWAGAQGEYIKKNVIAQFEKDFGCKVFVDEDWTLAQIARLRAGKANPRHTVMFMDDLGIEICKREGLIDALPREQMPNLAQVYPRFVYDDGYGVAIGISMGGVAYNPKRIKAPESYHELWEARFRRRITLGSMTGTGGPFMVIIAAALATGKPYQEAQHVADAAFPKLAELKPNILNIYTSNAQAANQIIQGEADIAGIDYSKWMYPYTVKGAPLDMAYPKEGIFAGVNCQALVKGGPHPELGGEFMNRMLDPKVQVPLAQFSLAAPPIRDLEFPADTLKYLAYPEEKMNRLKLFSPDWKLVNRIRPQWTEQWNKIFTA
jgi:putative spermidine/putrescine transport system substrate-binding protein